MIEIYNEVDMIQTILKDGISPKWERDVALLVKHYKQLGYKKSDAKNLIKQMCEKQEAYNPIISCGTINKIIDTVWKNGGPLREITKVEITKEVLDWFLSLEDSIVLTDDEVLREKEKRPTVVSIKNHPINWKRVKCLFTLYIWSKIQETYSDNPNTIYLDKCASRFLDNADLKPSFVFKKERLLLYDLKLIEINYHLGIVNKFTENDVFNIPVTDENKIVIDGDDLYHCGYWLEKQKMGSFICQCCGKETAYYSTNRQEHKRKYCKECADKLYVSKSGAKKDKARATKRFCIDCGKEITIWNDNDFKTCRCYECQNKRNNESKKRYKLKQKEITK